VGEVLEVGSDVKRFRPGDIVLTLGAGDVWKAGEEFLRAASAGGVKPRSRRKEAHA